MTETWDFIAESSERALAAYPADPISRGLAEPLLLKMALAAGRSSAGATPVPVLLMRRARARVQRRCCRKNCHIIVLASGPISLW